LWIDPDMKQQTFTGEVKIAFTVKKQTPFVNIHIKNINIELAQLRASDGSLFDEVELVEDTDFVC